MGAAIAFFSDNPYWVVFASAGVILGVISDLFGLRSRLFNVPKLPTQPHIGPPLHDLRKTAWSSAVISTGAIAADILAHHTDHTESLVDIAGDLTDIADATQPAANTTQGMLDDLFDLLDPT